MTAPPGSTPQEQPVLVCGLGAFGQGVLARLLPFAIPLRLLDLHPPDWRLPSLEQALADAVVLGDMRRPRVLRQAGAEQARAVLLLGSDSTANFEAALQVRLLNPEAEIVVRSSSDLDHLGSLLQQRLPGLTVVDPVQLTAGALVQALRPGQQLARFSVDGDAFEVFRGRLDDRRFQRPLRLDHDAGDLLVAPVSFQARQTAARSALPGERRRLRSIRLLGQLGRWCAQRTRLQWTLVAVVAALLLLGVPLFSRPGGWVQGAFVTLALLKGEYVDPTNVLIRHQPGSVSGDGWLLSATLLYSLVGTLLTSGLVALILDQLLSARFGLRRRRAVRRSAEPILLVGGGPLAGRVASQLAAERHTVVRVESDPAVADDGCSAIYPSLELAGSALAGVPVRAVAALSGHLLEDLRHTLQLQARWSEARFAMQQSLARYLGLLPAVAATLLREGSGAGVPIDPDCGSLLERDLRRQGVQVRLEATAC